MPKDLIISRPDCICVGNTLIRLHVSLGHLAEAQEVCDRLEARDVVSWNALITGYSRSKHDCEEALKCLARMLHEGLHPNSITLASALKSCGRIRAASVAKQIHARIWQETGLVEENIVVGTALVDVYGKCGMLAESQRVFDRLRTRNSVSWNALVAGYAQFGTAEEAMLCYEQMQLEGLHPNVVTFLSLLKACASAKAVEKGEFIHADILRQGLLQNNAILGTALVDMYGKCNALAKAEETFHLISVRNLFCWSVLIAGFTQQGQGQNALNCFEQMQCEGTFADTVTLLCILKACGMLDALQKGISAHAVIAQQGFLEDVVLGTALLDMYAKCGELAKAQHVFDQIPNPNTVCWTAMIAAYTQNGQGEEALICFEQMKEKGLNPDAVTFDCALNACGTITDIDKGKEIHTEIIKGGLLETYTSVGASLVDMYAKCGDLVKAKEVLENLHARDVVSWTALIAGYAQHGYGKEALDSFQQMKHDGHSPEQRAYVCIFKACGDIKAINEGTEIHAEMVKEGFLGTNILVGNALVEMYAKFENPAKAQEVFDQLPVQDITSWNALIAAYVQVGSDEEALNQFWKMHSVGTVPDVGTYLCVLKACGNIGCVSSGENIYCNLVRYAFVLEDSLSGTALVDMYVKCGLLTKAHEVFNQVMVRDVIIWSALITGYAQFGEEEIVVNIFNQMIQEGLQPDAATFTVVLNACSHSGLLEKAELVFKSLVGEYGIIPTLAHHACMVDLFCRAGDFDKAVVILQNMPTSDYFPAWISLLSGCNKCSNVKLGETVFDHVLQLNESHPSAYVCMGNIYAVAGE